MFANNTTLSNNIVITETTRAPQAINTPKKVKF
jgi:hypothetical protein